MAQNNKKKKGSNKVKKAKLLDGEDDFTESFLAVINEIFARFDEDKDGYLSAKELDNFATACNGTPFDDDMKQQITDNFDTRESDNALSLKGFMELYHLQSSSEPEETWKDLKKLGYNDQLQKINQ